MRNWVARFQLVLLRSTRRVRNSDMDVFHEVALRVALRSAWLLFRWPATLGHFIFMNETHQAHVRLYGYIPLSYFDPRENTR